MIRKTTRTKAQLEEERDFLLARHPGGFSDHSWVGLSSDCMVEMAILGTPFPDAYPNWWPSDEGDLDRCEETYKRAPEHLRPFMLPTLERFRRHVTDGGIYCRGCDTSGHMSTRHHFCRACQEERGIAA